MKFKLKQTDSIDTIITNVYNWKPSKQSEVIPMIITKYLMMGVIAHVLLTKLSTPIKTLLVKIMFFKILHEQRKDLVDNAEELKKHFSNYVAILEEVQPTLYKKFLENEYADASFILRQTSYNSNQRPSSFMEKETIKLYTILKQHLTEHENNN